MFAQLPPKIQYAVAELLSNGEVIAAKRICQQWCHSQLQGDSANTPLTLKKRLLFSKSPP